MNTYAIPVRLSIKESVTGTKAPDDRKDAGKGDFLSILRQQSESSRETTDGKKSEPVKRADWESESKTKRQDSEKVETQDASMSPKEQSEAGESVTEAADQAQADADQKQESTSGQGDKAEKSGSEAGEESLSAVLMSAMMVQNQESQETLVTEGLKDGASSVEHILMDGGAGSLQSLQKLQTLKTGEDGEKAAQTAAQTVAQDPGTLAETSSSKAQENFVKGTSGGDLFSSALRMAGSREKQPIVENQGAKEPGLFKEAQMEVVKTSANGGGGQPDSDTGNPGQEGKDLSKWLSLDRAVRGGRHMETGETSQKQETVSLEDLQKKAEQNVFLPFERLVGAKLSGGSMLQAVSNQGVTDATPLPDQLRAGIEQGLAKNLNQFTIRLKPEGLGEILVHMTSAGGKISLSIGVSNMDTQRLLSSEMMHLKETLQPLNAEVQEIYHNSQGGMDMMSYEQGFFQNQQRFAEGAGSRHGRPGRAGGVDEDDEAAQQTEPVINQVGYGRLSAYI